MRVLIKLLIVCFPSILLAQQYKLDYAQKLSKKMDYYQAYPVWDELSTSCLNDSKVGCWEIIRQTIIAAEKSELYEEALNWSNVLMLGGSANDTDKVINFELLCLNSKYDTLKVLIDSLIVNDSTTEELKLWKNNYQQLLNNLNIKSDFSVDSFNVESNNEVYGAYPYEKGILYVSSEYDYGFINRTYQRTNSNYTQICYFNPDALKTKKRIWQKVFWTDFIFKNQWRGIKQSMLHDGPISFSPDGKFAFVTCNQEKKDVDGTIKATKLSLKVFALKGKNWVEIKFPYNDINYNTGHGTMDSKGNLYFVSDKPGGIGGVDIYQTKFKNGKWSEPSNLGDKINSDKNDLFPYISAKGKLYFSSNGWNSIGGLDIYVSKLDQNNPVSLGQPINSAGDDFSFYLNEETAKGYISSNRNHWKDEIFKIEKTVFKINLLVKLHDCTGKKLSGKKIYVRNTANSQEKELLTDIEGKTQLFEAEKGVKYLVLYKGDDNLYGDSISFASDSEGDFEKQLNAKSKKSIYKIAVQNEQKNPLDRALIKVYKNKAILKYFTDKQGNVNFMLSANDSKIDSIQIQLINYEDFKIKDVSKAVVGCNDTVFQLVTMQQKRKSEFIRLDMILYSFDKYELRPESKIELDKLVKYMKERPDLKVELSSHTDSRGTFEYNMELSDNRSKSCVEYIISKGISPEMIIAKGYGESKLVNHCSDGVECSDEEHQQNRRTELKFISGDEYLDNEKLEK
jgi:outer membrane protein OmpA-like peptidoglycan-associated protein